MLKIIYYAKEYFVKNVFFFHLKFLLFIILTKEDVVKNKLVLVLVDGFMFRFKCCA